MDSSDYCEEPQNKNISGGNSALPSLNVLVEGSDFYRFITNPNMRPEGNGVYAINFMDPDYIEGEDYITIAREERLDSDAGKFIIRVNVKERTATLIDDDELIDLSEEYFDDSFIESQ